jgi:predicted RNA-binding Zn-ribbon protein involved in translation (DUF1610 family)
MLKFCRSCGKELAAAADRTCPNCGSNAVKATAFCRFCGKPTSPEEKTCSSCGGSLKPITHNERAFIDSHRKLAKAGKIVNLSLIAVVVAAYVIFALPKSIKRPIQQTASDVVQASTGYTALPLQYIAATPQSIPTPATVGEVSMPSAFDVNATRQVGIYAIYKNMDGSVNETKATRMEDVTLNCTYKTSNPSVIQVSPEGVIHAVGYGTAYVIAYYTAAPGTSDRKTAASGKVPVTFNVTISVTVGHRGQELFDATYT